jgi:hypothetical protein
VPVSVTKKYLAKVYDQDGSTPLKTLVFERTADGSMHVKNEPHFNAKMNGGLGELILDLKTPFDSFEEGTTVDFENVVDVYAVVIDDVLKTQTSRRIYSGLVSMYDPYFEGGEEGVRVTLLGFGSNLTAAPYGASPAYSVTHSGQDPRDIATAIIDNYNSAFGGSLIGYGGTTSAVGSTVTKTFTGRTWMEALQDDVELAGTGWWYSIDRDRKLNFLPKPSSYTHLLTIGKDIVRFNAPKSREKVKNEIIVERSGGTRTAYSDATSQAKFGTGSPATGRRTEIITDSTIADVTTADARGNKALGDQKDEKIRATVVVNSNYDIESIKPGDTVKITNFLRANTFFSNNMQVVELTYEVDTVTLQLEELAVNFGAELAEFVG